MPIVTPTINRELSVASSMTPNSMELGSPSTVDSTRATAGLEDVQMIDVETISNVPDEQRFIIAVDFGTTFSSISFISLNRHQSADEVSRRQIQSITGYPLDQSVHAGHAKDVPTEIWYPLDPNFRTAIGLEITEHERPRSRCVADDDENGEEEEEDYAWPNSDDNEGFQDFEDEPLDDNGSRSFLWGYSVQDALKHPDSHSNPRRKLISRFKLLLDQSPHTEEVRNHLKPTIGSLKKRKIIKKEANFIEDYLTFLFRHAYAQLTKKYHYTRDSITEFVLCVPAVWTQKACRIMQMSMASAMIKSGFRGAESGSIDDLFIVSEPEAAAAYVLEDSNDIKPGNTFILIDAGGGTVDAITYTVSNTQPLRLVREAVNPGGGLYGSSYLNENLRRFLKEKLKDETYLENEDIKIDGIIESIVIQQFENNLKRQLNLGDRSSCYRALFIQGLRPNAGKKFIPNRLQMQPADFDMIFMPCLQGIAQLMRDQFEAARAKDIEVDKVILIGGFAASPTLKLYLDSEVKKLSTKCVSNIRLIRPNAPATAVASGAVLRALNKTRGPERFIRSSYGFLRAEHYQPLIFPEHKEAKPRRDKVDGMYYLKNTIHWVVQKGVLLEPHTLFEPLLMYHTFEASPNVQFICREELYVSDNSTESHYRKSHEKNKGAEYAGDIEVDMTFLRTQNLIQVIEPEYGEKRKGYYKVEYELHMMVDGRNLRYFATYPPGTEGHVLKEGQISISAAFVPGTC